MLSLGLKIRNLPMEREQVWFRGAGKPALGLLELTQTEDLRVTSLKTTKHPQSDELVTAASVL